MANIFEADFEEGDLTDVTGSLTESGNSVAASSSAPHTGTYGARCTLGGTNDQACVYKDISAELTIYARAYIDVSSLDLPNSSGLTILAAGETAYDEGAQLRAIVDGSGDWAWRVQFGYGGYTSSTSSYATKPSGYYRFELYSHNNGGTGDDTIRARVYNDSGVLVWDSNNVTMTSVSKTHDTIYAGCYKGTTSGSSTLDVDNFGADDADWLGPVGVVFASGIETEVDAFTTEFTSKVEEGSNTLTVSSTPAHINSGSKGAKITFDGTNNGVYAYKTVADQDEVYFRGYLKVNAAFNVPTDYQSCKVFEIKDDTQSLMELNLRVQADDQAFRWRCIYWNGSGNTTILDGVCAEDPALDTWMRASGSAVPGATSELYFDDIELDNTDWIGGLDTGPTEVEQDPVGAMVLAGFNPTVGTATGLWEMGAYIYDVLNEIKVNPTLGTMVLQGHNPTVSASGAGADVDATLGTMELAGFNPIVGATNTKADRKPAWDWQSIWRKW